MKFVSSPSTWVTAEAGDSYWAIAHQLGYTSEPLKTQAAQAIQSANANKPLWVGTYVLIPEGLPVVPNDGISDKLVPEAGKILLGSSVERAGIAGYVAVAGKNPDIVHAYSVSASGFAADVARVPTGSIPFVNNKPVGTMGQSAYESVLAGDADATLDAIASTIIAYGRPIFVAFMHEPENDGSSASDSLHRDAYRYCVTHMRSRGADNGVWVWNMMGYLGHLDRYDGLYPGNEYVDYIASDPYCHQDDDFDFINFVDKSTFNSQGGDGFYTWAAQHGKPIMLAEWGIDSDVVGAVGPSLLSQRGIDQLQADMPLIRALVYWDQAKAGDYRLSNFEDLWRDFIELPTFDVDLTTVT